MKRLLPILLLSLAGCASSNSNLRMLQGSPHQYMPPRVSAPVDCESYGYPEQPLASWFATGYASGYNNSYAALSELPKDPRASVAQLRAWHDGVDTGHRDWSDGLAYSLDEMANGITNRSPRDKYRSEDLEVYKKGLADEVNRCSARLREQADLLEVLAKDLLKSASVADIPDLVRQRRCLELKSWNLANERAMLRDATLCVFFKPKFQPL